MDMNAERQARINAACLERDLAAYACAGVLRALKETGRLEPSDYAHEVLRRYDDAKAALEAASGVRQVEPEVSA